MRQYVGKMPEASIVGFMQNEKQGTISVRRQKHDKKATKYCTKMSSRGSHTSPYWVTAAGAVL